LDPATGTESLDFVTIRSVSLGFGLFLVRAAQAPYRQSRSVPLVP